MTINAKSESQPPLDTNSSTYYVSDYSKLSLAELWQQRSRNPFRMLFVARLLVAKITRRPQRRGVPSLHDNLKHIELSEIPENVRHDIEPAIRSLQSAGFAVRLVRSGLRSKGNYGYGVQLLSADRLSLASIAFAHVTVGQHAKAETAVGIATYRQRGRTILTSNAPRRIKSPPEIQVNRLVGATPEQLLIRHRKSLLNCTDAVVIRDEEIADRVQSFSRRFNEFQIGRGFYVPANSEEMIRYRDQIISPGFFEIS